MAIKVSKTTLLGILGFIFFLEVTTFYLLETNHSNATGLRGGLERFIQNNNNQGVGKVVVEKKVERDAVGIQIEEDETNGMDSNDGETLSEFASTTFLGNVFSHMTETEDLTKYVDILRGTSAQRSNDLSRGNVLPIISRPFGSTHWAIKNHGETAWWFNPTSDGLDAIRCTHQPSPWIGDYGFFDVIPTFENERQTTFDLQSKVLTPYSMKLKLMSECCGGSCAELDFAGTNHGGIMVVRTPLCMTGKWRILQFKFLSSFTGRVDRDKNVVYLEGDSTRTTVFKAPTTMKHHIVAEIRFTSSQTVPGEDQIFVVQSAHHLKWRSSLETAEVVIRFGTSFIDKDQARRNLQREVGLSYDYDTILEQGKAEWNLLLNRVVVEPDESQSDDEVKELKEVLYTCMYRALLFPRQLGEIDANDELIHYSPYDNYGKTYPGPLSTDSGFWDAYRAVYPFLHLVFPDLVETVLEGWVNAIREDPNNMLAQWASPGRVGSMVGSMGEVSMAEGILNDAIRGKSADDVYRYMKRSALENTPQGREHLKEYIKYGYVPFTPQRDGTAALSLNYYLSDYVVSLAARYRGDEATANKLEKRSGNWRHLFDTDTLFFRAKDTSGNFRTPFDQYLWMKDFTEGGPWQYRFYVPHDPKGLRKAYESKGESKHGDVSRMCEILKEDMVTANTVSNRAKIHEETEMQVHSFGQYSHNNQPVHHVLYMFAHAGCPLEGQKWIHQTLRTQYGSFGYAGDEDNGEMSSWYILSSFGLYALVPGQGYQIGAPPLFKSITVKRHLRGGDLRISRESIPVSKNPKSWFTPATKITWNGKNYDLSADAVTIPYNELLQGGDLVFHL